MNSKIFYKFMSGMYDLLDVIYFRKPKSSPRKAVLDTIQSEDKILDLCTGTATNAIRISQPRPDTKIAGIDISRDMLRVANEKRRKKNVQNVKLYCMDATDMKFKDKSFDKVLLSLVLHELEDELAGKILKEAKRVLKDDGEIVVTEWEPSSSLSRRILFAPVAMLEPKTYRTFIKKNLYAYFKEYGLDIVEEMHCDYTKVLRVRKCQSYNCDRNEKGK